MVSTLSIQSERSCTMSSRKQWLGRAAVNATLAVILVLVAILSPFVGAPTTNVAALAAAPAVQQPTAGRVVSGREAREAETGQPTAPGEPVQAQEADTFYILEWDIQAVGHQDIQVDPKS